MITEQRLKRDERTVAVENASCKWAFYFLAFAVLIDAVYRQKVRNEDVGDLVALAGVSAAIGTVYLIRHKAWVSDWPWKWKRTVIVLASCIVVAVLVSILAIILTITKVM